MWLGGKQMRINKEPVGGSRELQRLGRILGEEPGIQIWQKKIRSVCFVSAATQHRHPHPSFCTSAQQEVCCRGRRDGCYRNWCLLLICSSSSSLSPLNFFFPTMSCHLYCTFQNSSKNCLHSAAERIYCGVNKQTKTLNPVPSQKHMEEVTDRLPLSFL